MKIFVIVISLSFLIQAKCQVNYQTLFNHGISLLKNGAAISNQNVFSLQNDYEEIKSSLLDFFARDVISPFSEISADCLLQIQTLANATIEKQQWTQNFLDAFGKPRSGILFGNTKWVGQFNECLNSINETVDFKSNYCTVKKPENNFDLFSMNIGLGICVPAKCSNKDIVELVNIGISIINLASNFTQINLTNITSDYINCNKPSEFDAGAVFALSLISVLAFFVLTGTIYDIYEQFKDNETKKEIGNTNNSDEEGKKINAKIKKPEPIYFQILLSFSAYTNLKKLFTVNKGADQLNCVHGIRFMSMGWVVLGHSFLFGFGVAENVPELFIQWYPRFSFMIVSNAFFSVDSFFLLSGLLAGYLFMKEMVKRNHVFSADLFFKFYIHRLWRITPPYMLVVMFTACLTQFLGTGPFYPTEKGLDPNCRTHWMYNLLYVNNIVEPGKMCFGIAWYLANDMQFHWISPVMLIPFSMGIKNKFFEYVGIIVSCSIIIINILVTSLIIYSKPGSELGTLGTESDFYQKNVYYTPWCRIGAFVVGVLLGYLIFKCKKNPNFRLNKLYNTVGWYIAIFALGLMLFGTYPNLNANPANHLNRAENILYQASSRIIWALALGFVIFSCVMNGGGFVNDILSWTIWTPLSRLSFSAYLIHFNVINWYYGSQKNTIFYSELNFAYNYIGTMVITYAASLVVTLLFEIPLLGLEKFIFGKKK